MELKYQSNPFCYRKFLILAKFVAKVKQSKTITKKKTKPTPYFQSRKN